MRRWMAACPHHCLSSRAWQGVLPCLLPRGGMLPGVGSFCTVTHSHTYPDMLLWSTRQVSQMISCGFYLSILRNMHAMLPAVVFLKASYMWLIPYHTCQSLGPKPSICLWLSPAQNRRGGVTWESVPQDGPGLHYLRAPWKLRGEEQDSCPAGPIISHSSGCSWQMGVAG